MCSLTFFDIFSACFLLVFCWFLNHQLVNWLRWQMLRTHALAPLWGHWLLAQHVAPENPQNHGPKSLRKKQKRKRESPFLILWSQKKICTFRLLSVALEGQGFQFVKNIERYAFSAPYATHSFFCSACVCICKPKKIRRSNVFVSCQTSAGRIQIE